MTNDTSRKRIFVQIASYRDPECHPTVADLFEKATHPERVHVGICWQYDPQSDRECFANIYPRAGQVRVIQYHVQDAQGAGWARNQAQTLWQGEEYILQIQAHMRFEPGWDETLIELYEQCPGEKKILTAWLPGYTPPDNRHQLSGKLPLSTVNRLGGAGDAQMVHLIKRFVPTESFGGAPALTSSWVGNFMFTWAETLKEVPFDPHIYFWGEEINYSARLWTHGYDIYHLDRLVMYHYWDRIGVKDAKIYRDHLDRRNRLSLSRNLHLFGIRTAVEPEALHELNLYRLGTARTLTDYWRFAGIDFMTGRIERFAREGKFAKSRSVAAVSAPSRIFVEIASYRDPECRHTLADMFAKAAHSGRIFAGICLQVDPAEKETLVDEGMRPGHIRIRQFHYEESQGANWARATAHQLWQGEEYVLQIDSHMRFEPGWDETLIDMLSRCPSNKPVICAYLPNYEPPDARDYHPGHLLRIRVRKFGGARDPQLLHLTGARCPVSDSERGGLYPSPFYIANFMFSRAETLKNVPIDPHFHFYGDEISYGARLWTHGYDIFQPDRVVLFHYWVRRETLHLQHYRDTRTERSLRSLARVKHLLGFESSDDRDALAEIDKYGLGSERSLEDLWAFAGIDWQRHRMKKASTEGYWDMAARKKALKGKTDKLPRIFVQIAAYRDPDCQWTVKDLFEKAAHPERIFVGICWQIVKEEDAICFEVPYPRPNQVRVHEVDARQGKGVCWARSLTQKLWQGEEFTLQIDSHMRFEPGWDDSLIEMWEACDREKAVLTCYPPGFTPPDDCQRTWIFGMAAKAFDKDGIFVMTGKPGFHVDKFPDMPIPGAFASACMFFAPGSFIKDVPYDPHLYFFGEEIALAVRAWTHGYDLYHPNRLVIYHDWDRGKRPTHFSDHRDWGTANKRAQKRVRHMLGTEPSSDPEIIKDLDVYGLGHARTLAEYEQYSGVDFAGRRFTEEAARGEYAPYVKPVVAIGRGYGKAERIYVQIASYRDRECQWTVKDLFEKAKNPDRITVGICWQFDEKEDQDCFQVSTRPEQVRILPVDWRESEGVCWARHQTQQLWDGEEYTLQIDSHMRFVPGWDELMIHELAACESEKPLISCNPAAYTPPNNLQLNPLPTIRRVQPFFPDGNIRGKGEFIERVPDKPLNGAFVAAGYVFARSNIIQEVPYDPYLYFDQEEITYAARLYTHGWDVFSARRQFLYHYYNDHSQGTVRKLHWRDLRKEDESRIAFLRERGMKRFNHFMGYRSCDNPEFLRDLGLYGFGRKRTLAQYEEYCGVDFKRKVASEKALRCLFIKDLAKWRSTPIHIPEIDGAGQTEVRRAPARLTMLEAGDFLPMFEIPDTNRKVRAIETFGGKHGLMVFLPAYERNFLSRFFAELDKQMEQAEKPDVWFGFVFDESVEALITLKESLGLSHVLWSDVGGKLAGLMGLDSPGERAAPPCAFIISRNLRIEKRHLENDPVQLVKALVTDIKTALRTDTDASPKVLSQVAPVLMVSDVFSPEFCRKCIEAFRTGHTFEGTVGAEQKMAYVPNAKVRTDYVVQDELLDEIDEKLSRSLFPEIKKIFGFEVTHRELYKIGLYTGEKGGFFRQHRDNFDVPLGYRRIAMTLHLSDDYDGGGLVFPEYDRNTVYRPKLGGAIAFSCAAMHEALPVTKGERFVLVGFFHGEEDEAFRRHYLSSKGKPLQISEYTPILRQYPGIRQSRDFMREWRAQNVTFGKAAVPLATHPMATRGDFTMPAQPVVQTLGGHKPRKVFESKGAIIFDDFLPEDVYQRVNNFALGTDYEYINTKGKIARAWHIHDGFPLRSTLNEFYYAHGVEKPQGDYVYPTKTAFDEFVDHMLAIQPHAEPMIGKQSHDWAHFSVTGWIYPHGTGLTMHDDGSGVYSGAYVYFLNPTWRTHWGGMLIMVDEEGNRFVHEHRAKIDQMDFYKKKWLQANGLDDLLMEHGFAKCIFPKKNRLVFIANDAYHMVTRVNEASGDNMRMSLAGFFHRKK